MSVDGEFYRLLFSAIGAITGSAAIIWNVYNFKISSRGYMKLNLDCSYLTEADATKRYLICKTSVENTGRTGLYIEYAFLIVLRQGDVSINNVTADICKEVEEKVKKKVFNINDPILINYLKENYTDEELVREHYLLKSLSYYYENNEKLGSFENMSTSYIYPWPPNIYEIYFFVFGRRKPLRKKFSSLRMIHSEVLLPYKTK